MNDQGTDQCIHLWKHGRWEKSSTQSFEGMANEIIERTFEGINEGINEGMKDYNQTTYAV
jgi:hypothetical protein